MKVNQQINGKENPPQNLPLRSKRLKQIKKNRIVRQKQKEKEKKKAGKNQSHQLQKNKNKEHKSKDTPQSKINQKKEKKVKKHILDEKQQELKNSILLQNKERYDFHKEKYQALTSIGIPTVQYEISAIKNYIQSLKQIGEYQIQKIIGVVGEGLVESQNEYITNLDEKKIIIQKRVVQILSQCKIHLDWNSEKWNKLIDQTLDPISYPQMTGVQITQNLSPSERYSIMFETLNLFHLKKSFQLPRIHHLFSSSLPLQTVAHVQLIELVNQNNLINVRNLRKYIGDILTVLDKIQQLQLQQANDQSIKELYKQQNTLQDLCVEYYQNKMKRLKLLPNRSNDYSNQDNEGPENSQAELQFQLKETKETKETKKPIKLNGKPRTLLEFFKPVRKNNNEIQQTESPKINLSKKPESPDYFSILEGYLKDLELDKNQSFSKNEKAK